MNTMLHQQWIVIISVVLSGNVVNEGFRWPEFSLPWTLNLMSVVPSQGSQTSSFIIEEECVISQKCQIPPWEHVLSLKHSGPYSHHTHNRWVV